MQDKTRCYIIELACIIREERNRMMRDTYVECLVKVKPHKKWILFRILVFVLLILSAILMLYMPIGFWCLCCMLVCQSCIKMFADIEYDYLYLDGELTVDIVRAKTRRKRRGVYDLKKMEICAPSDSVHLDSYRNRKVKAKDYSSNGLSDCYEIYFEDGIRILISPNEELIHVLSRIAPRKVFTE